MNIQVLHTTATSTSTSTTPPPPTTTPTTNGTFHIDNNNDNTNDNNNDNNNDSKTHDCWTVVARCVTVHPNYYYDGYYHNNDNNDDNNGNNDNNMNDNESITSSSSSLSSPPIIETCWEVSNNNNNNNILQEQRIAIYNYNNNNNNNASSSSTTTTTTRTLHVSMSLPSDASINTTTTTNHHYNHHHYHQQQQQQQQQNVLAWVHFSNTSMSNMNNNNNNTTTTTTSTERDPSSSSLLHQRYHKVLCCLYNSNSICIWDVFPSNSLLHPTNRNTNHPMPMPTATPLIIPSEGWIITLPFDCRTIHPLAAFGNNNSSNHSRHCDGGLLLQRYEEEEVVVEDNHNNVVAVSNNYEMNEQQHDNNNNNHNDVYNENDFLLLEPPSLWKYNNQNQNTNSKTDTRPFQQQQHQQEQQHFQNNYHHDNNNNNNQMSTPVVHTATSTTTFQSHHHQQQQQQHVVESKEQQQQLHNNEEEAVVSLFTLHHPLEDVVPVMSLSSIPTAFTTTTTSTNTTNNNTTTDPVSDVMEQVVFVGTTEWISSSSSTTTATSNTGSTSTTKQQQKHHYHQQQIMVTYHVTEQRHSIYTINKAPSPPIIPPLYEQTRLLVQQQQQQQSMKTKDYSHFGPRRDIVDTSFDDDVDDEDMIVGHNVHNDTMRMVMDLDLNDAVNNTTNDDDDDDDDINNIDDDFGIPTLRRRSRNSHGNNSNSHHHHPSSLVVDHDAALADALLGGNRSRNSISNNNNNSKIHQRPTSLSPRYQPLPSSQPQPTSTFRTTTTTATSKGSFGTTTGGSFASPTFGMNSNRSVTMTNPGFGTYPKSATMMDVTQDIVSANITDQNIHQQQSTMSMMNNNPDYNVFTNSNSNTITLPVSSTNDYFHSRLRNTLHPRIAIQCLYKETVKKRNDGTSNATALPLKVCLISNKTTTGKLVLVILRNNNVLTLYSIVTGSGPHYNTSYETIVGVNLITSIPYIADIVPITASSSIPLYSTTMVLPVTDLLVLEKQSGQCILYRSNIPITRCIFQRTEGIDRSNFNAAKLSDPVLNTFTVSMFSNSTSNEYFSYSAARCHLSLSVQTKCTTAERILSCLDVALYRMCINKDKSDISTDPFDFIRLALKIRADCIRLYDSATQIPYSTKLSDCNLPSLQQLVLLCLRVVIVQVQQYILTRNLVPPISESFEPQQPSTETNTSSWEALCASDFHQAFATNLRELLPIANDTFDTKRTSSSDKLLLMLQGILSSIGSLSIHDIQEHYDQHSKMEIFSTIFDSIHILYEDEKLSGNRSANDLSFMSSMLVDITRMVYEYNDGRSDLAQSFLNYYSNGDENVNPLQQKRGNSSIKSVDSDLNWTSFKTPPSVLNWIHGSIVHGSNYRSFETQYGNSIHPDTINPVCAKTRLVLRIFSFFRNEYDSPEDDLTVVKILLEEGYTNAAMIHEELCMGVSIPLLDVLHRCRNIESYTEVPGFTKKAWMLVGREDLGLNIDIGRNETPNFSSLPSMESNGYESNDGLQEIERSAAMIFPDDNRVHEAARLLCSSRPIFLRVGRPVEVSDHDFERLKQKRLLTLCYRALALPTGRGMLTIGRFKPNPVEPVPIPELCLKGRVPPTNSTLNLDTSECPSDMQVWPDFHNGVAAGLRLPSKDHMVQSNFAISRTWIVYNRPATSRTTVPSPQDSGDDTNTTTNVQNYSHGGFLLALGLQGHLDALDMSDVYEYLTEGCATTTVGILLGMASNKRGSCDLSVSKMLCLHIPSLIPQHFSAIDVASIVQTSAIIGAGLLFQGSSHRMMTEFLLNEIGKRPDSDINTSDRESYTLACGLALGTVNLCLGDTPGTDNRRLGLADLRIEERLIKYVIGGIDRGEIDRTRESNDRFNLPNPLAGSDSEKCSTIYESNLINTSVTSPGATLALGLIYMKTSNKAVAGSLALPDTHFLLEFVRPDFLGYRVISMALILWDEVEPNKKWVDEQIPLVVRQAYEKIGIAAKAAYSTRWPAANRSQVEEYDRRAIKQIHTYIVSSACFALGLRYAGTGNADAKTVIAERVMELHSLREATDPVSMAMRPEIQILELCLGTAAISLAMVLAGTGDLDALRIFKILRWRCDSDGQYGTHMIFAMCIGLLFLGGGSCTLGRDPADIAALVTAFFPRFPDSTSDNQYHLQALRHLYVLAVKRTEMRAIDVDTKENVHVNVRLFSTYNNPDTKDFRVPCLLRNSDNPHQELKVLSDNYYPLKFKLSEHNGTCSFFVKRRYATRPTSFMSETQATTAHKGMLGGFSRGDPLLISFSDYFLDDRYLPQNDPVSDLHHNREDDFLCRVINSCQVNDCKEYVLPLYLKFWYSTSNISNIDPDSQQCYLWDIRIMQTYYRQRQIHSTSSFLETDMLLPYLLEYSRRQTLQTFRKDTKH